MKAYHWRNLIAERDRLARLDAGRPAPDAPPVQVTLPPTRERPAKVAEPAGEPPLRLGVIAPPPEPTTRRVVPAVTPGKPICIECRHFVKRMCTSENARNPVTGEYVEAERARRYEDGCGPRGRQWEARPAYTVPILPRDDSEPEQYIPPVPFKVVEWKPYRDEVVAVLWKPGMYATEQFQQGGEK